MDIRAGQTVNVLCRVKAREVMRDEYVSVSQGEQLMSVVSRFIENPGGSVFVNFRNERIFLTGKTEFVFEGSIDI